MRLRFLSSHKGLIYITLGNLLGAAATGAFWLLLALIQNADEYGKTNYEISLAKYQKRNNKTNCYSRYS